MARKNCQHPDACVAPRRGRCPVCNPISAEQRDRMTAGYQRFRDNPVARARWSSRHRAAMADVETRQKIQVGVARSLLDPAVLVRRRSAARESNGRPETRAAIANSMKAAWSDESYRRRMIEVRSDPVTRAKWSASRSGLAHVRLPRWVIAADLVDDFLGVAEFSGEEAAASHCRRLKREMLS